MRVTEIECLILDETYPFVMIRTDEGITGYGESFRRGPHVQKAAIDTIFAPLVIGKDPFDTAEIWDAMHSAGNVAGPSGTLQTAAAAIDIALWDIKGKALGLPLYKLLGGKRKDRIRVYASSLRRDLTAVEEANRAASFQAEGFTGYKMHSAVPGATDHPDDRTVEHVREMREAVGDDFEILVDINGAYSLHNAIEIGKQLEDYGVFHFEQPLPIWDLDGMAALARADVGVFACAHHPYRSGGDFIHPMGIPGTGHSWSPGHRPARCDQVRRHKRVDQHRGHRQQSRQAYDGPQYPTDHLNRGPFALGGWQKRCSLRTGVQHRAGLNSR